MGSLAMTAVLAVSVGWLVYLVVIDTSTPESRAEYKKDAQKKLEENPNYRPQSKPGKAGTPLMSKVNKK